MKNKFSLKISAILLIIISLVSTASAQDTLYVGIYGNVNQTEQQVLRYNQNGTPMAPTPWLGTGSTESPTGIKSEEIAVGQGYASVETAQEPVANPIYIGNAGAGTIEIANANAANNTNPIVNANFITGLNGVAGVALSNNGQDLYVAQQNAGTVSEYNALTGALITSVAITDAHDIVVGANGSVYVTAYAAGQTTDSVGVVEFNSNLTNETTFIAPSSTVGAGLLSRATGMVFDKNGNLWVANVYAPGGSVNNTGPSTSNFVSEYSSTGQLITTVESNGNNLYTVFGLSLGSDGNIYAASFNGHQITEINTTTDTASTFITLPTGDEPKYATWSSDAITYSSVPEPKASSAIVLGGMALLLVFRWLKRTLLAAFRVA